MPKKDYYEVLGVSRNATAEEIKAAYKRLAKKYHPDVSQSADAEARFKEVGEAYQILSDPQKRAAYDRLGHTAFDQAARSGFAGQGFSRQYADFDLGDLFGAGFRDPFDIFEEFFGTSPFGAGQAAAAHQHQRGSDLLYRLKLSFKEAALGTQKDIFFEHIGVCKICKGTGSKNQAGSQTCPACQGRGQVQQTSRTVFGSFATLRTCPHCQGQGEIIKDFCPECQGSGQLPEKKRLTIKVPPGADTGHQLKFRGQGNAGERGAPAGDLYVRFQVEEQPVFRRDGADLYLEVPISFSQAALGDNLEIPTLNQKVKMKLPAGTQSGTEFRLKGKGLPRFGQSGQGDLYATVEVVTPEKLDKKGRQLFEKLQEFEQKPASPWGRLFLV